MIVKHPFTDTGVSAIPDGKGGVEMIDLTEDDAQLRWRQSMARQIDKADSAYAIYMMVTKPYALTFLKFAMPHLSREDKPATDGGNGISGQDQAESENHEPQQTPPKKPGDKKGGGGAVIREKPSAKQTTPLPKPEVKPNEPS